MILALKIIPITDEFQLFWPSGPQQLLEGSRPSAERREFKFAGLQFEILVYLSWPCDLKLVE